MSDLVPHQDNTPKFIQPIVNVSGALAAYQGMKDFVERILRSGVDYGEIPGTNKPTLLKPGAEKLARFFGLSISLQVIEKVEDWIGEQHGGEAFFFYRYKAVSHYGAQPVAEGIGSCNSWEKKYRYRKAERKCPACGKTAIIKGNSQYGGGWLCWKKKDGCGAKFPDGAPEIENQQAGDVKNADPADIVNTIDKMAQKRAIIACVLLSCNASEYFTQDIEDYTDAEFIPVSASQPVKLATPQTPAHTVTVIAPENQSDEEYSFDTVPTSELAAMATELLKTKDNPRRLAAIKDELAARQPKKEKRENDLE